jgi:hypothetical protein
MGSDSPSERLTTALHERGGCPLPVTPFGVSRGVRACMRGHPCDSSLPPPRLLQAISSSDEPLCCMQLGGVSRGGHLPGREGAFRSVFGSTKRSGRGQEALWPPRWPPSEGSEAPQESRSQPLEQSQSAPNTTSASHPPGTGLRSPPQSPPDPQSRSAAKRSTTPCRQARSDLARR